MTKPHRKKTDGDNSGKADYTILFYGIGGGDLDLIDEQTILDMARSLPDEKSNVRVVVEYKYSSEKGGNMNFSLTDLTKVGPFLNALKEITTYLCAHKVDNLNGYLAAAGKTYQYDQEDSKFDIYDYLYFLGKEVYSKDQEYHNLLATVKKTLDVAQPIHYNSLECKGDDYYDNLSYSVMLGAQGYIVEYDEKGRIQIARDKDDATYNLVENLVDILPLDVALNSAWNKTYELTTFDKTVGWSKWFVANPAFPRNNPPFYNFQMPDKPVSNQTEDEDLY